LKKDTDQATSEFKATEQIGQHLVGNVEGRYNWLELLKAIDAVLPTDPPRKADAPALPISERKELHITNVDCQQMEDVGAWYAVAKQWNPQPTEADKAASEATTPPPTSPVPPAGVVPVGGPKVAPGVAPAAVPSAGAAGEQPEAAEPKGPGWIVRLSGYHYHNADRNNQGAQYIRKTLIENVRTGKIQLPNPETGKMEEVSLKELGIFCPILINPTKVEKEIVNDPYAEEDSGPQGPGNVGGGMPGMPGVGGGARPRMPAGEEHASNPKTITLQRFDFVVHFCWQPKTPTERLEAKKAKEKEAKEKAQSDSETGTSTGATK
jgi:type IV pilus assembly protein PilM